jgi:hypothetical protein
MTTQEDALVRHVREHFKEYTYDMFMMNVAPEPEEMILFSNWVDTLNREKSTLLKPCAQAPKQPK